MSNPTHTGQIPTTLEGGPAVDAETVDISGGDHALRCRALYVGGTGNVVCRLIGSTADVTFSAVPVGTVLPISLKKVTQNGTTATLMVALK